MRKLEIRIGKAHCSWYSFHSENNKWAVLSVDLRFLLLLVPSAHQLHSGAVPSPPNVKFNCWTSKDKLFNWIMVCLNETKRIQRFLKHFGDFGENCWTDWPRLFCFPIPDHHLKKQDTLVTSPNMCFFFSSPSFVCFCKRHVQGVFIAPKPGADLGGGCRGRAPPPPPLPKWPVAFCKVCRYVW